jgi:hypothetical protein
MFGVMLPFIGTTLTQNTLNISELLPELWWMDKRPRPNSEGSMESVS